MATDRVQGAAQADRRVAPDQEQEGPGPTVAQAVRPGAVALRECQGPAAVGRGVAPDREQGARERWPRRECQSPEVVA